MVGERVQELQVVFARVCLLPGPAHLAGIGEDLRDAQRLAVATHGAEEPAGIGRGRPREEHVVDRLRGLPERRVVRDVEMPHQREGAAGLERLGGFCDAGLRFDPVERLRRDDEIERLRLRGPGLKPESHDLDVRVWSTLAGGESGHRIAGLQREDRVAPHREWQRDLSRSTADLENSSGRGQPGQCHDRVDDLGGISRPHLVVEAGDVVEGSPDPLGPR